ncbi:MAG: hypothetical protein ACFFBD_15360 [Candidatus Hodarchaeota archaeon]
MVYVRIRFFDFQLQQSLIQNIFFVLVIIVLVLNCTTRTYLYVHHNGLSSLYTIDKSILPEIQCFSTQSGLTDYALTTNKTLPLNKISLLSSLEGAVQPISPQYMDHEPISINNNTDFLAQAANEGWSGQGTAADPIIISNCRINSSSNTLLKIQNTDLYFQISEVSNIISFGE